MVCRDRVGNIVGKYICVCVCVGVLVTIDTLT